MDRVPQVWLYPKGKKGPPFPIDLTPQADDIRDFVKMVCCHPARSPVAVHRRGLCVCLTAGALATQIRKACEIPKEEREMEAEYQAAAARFKAAVRKLPTTLKAAVEELNRGAAALEALV